MTSILLLVALNADTLVSTKVSDLTLKLPQAGKEWKSEEADEANGRSRTVKTTDGEAQIDISVFSVDPKRDAAVCLEQLLKALGPEGYEMVTIGGAAAAKKMTIDYVGDSEAAKKEENKVNTFSYVGCNGSTKWVMSMTSKASKAPRFGVLLKRVVESIGYAK
jgi:hypothetical protein